MTQVPDISTHVMGSKIFHRIMRLCCGIDANRSILFSRCNDLRYLYCLKLFIYMNEPNIRAIWPYKLLIIINYIPD